LLDDPLGDSYDDEELNADENDRYYHSDGGTSRCGYTPLQLAFHYCGNNPPLVAQLLEVFLQSARFDVNTPDGNGNTVLHTAVSSLTNNCNSIETMRQALLPLLRVPSLNIDSRTSLGMTPLLHLFHSSLALSKVDLVVAMADLLLQHGASIHATTLLYSKLGSLRGGENLVTLAALSCEFGALQVSNRSSICLVFEWLRQRGADFNHLNGHGHTAADIALRSQEPVLLAAVMAAIQDGMCLIVPKTIPGQISMQHGQPGLTYMPGARFILPSPSAPSQDDIVAKNHQVWQEASERVSQEVMVRMPVVPICRIVREYAAWQMP
jgi:hypothetical protein